jgi:hypothetical protein
MFHTVFYVDLRKEYTKRCCGFGSGIRCLLMIYCLFNTIFYSKAPKSAKVGSEPMASYGSKSIIENYEYADPDRKKYIQIRNTAFFLGGRFLACFDPHSQTKLKNGSTTGK